MLQSFHICKLNCAVFKDKKQLHGTSWKCSVILQLSSWWCGTVAAIIPLHTHAFAENEITGQHHIIATKKTSTKVFVEVCLQDICLAQLKQSGGVSNYIRLDFSQYTMHKWVPCCLTMLYCALDI